MGAPSVRYVRTPDGFDIAYCVTGEGRPLVMMWDMPHGCFEFQWNSKRSRTFFEPLAARFKLVQLDCRGNGNSSRGLTDRHTIDDYVLDLETVVDCLHLDSFVLIAPVFAAHVISRFALKHPHRVAGLVFVNPMPPEDPWEGMGHWEGLYTNEWDLFIEGYTRIFFPDGDEDWSNYVRDVVTTMTIAGTRTLFQAPVSAGYYRNSRCRR